MKKLLNLALVLLCAVSSSYANAIVVSNLVVDAPNQEVTFDIEWSNSWRLDGIAAPFNWDAAWVFVKHTPCDSISPNLFPDWDHGQLSTTVGDHSFGNLEPVLNDGTVGIADSLGVMLRRNATGFFTAEGPANVTLSVPSLNPSNVYHLRVFAIEMVYVNEDSYTLGGMGSNNSFDSLYISNESATTITSLATGANASVNLSASFPKGFNAFHCMKYEISHGQYADFLNTINATQATNRYFNTTANRHVLTNGNGAQFQNYQSIRENRAMNYLAWDDLLAYLDWAAMAPMTEMQYEKACRGPIAPSAPDEFAWGSTFFNNGNQFTGAENGTEYFADATANCVLQNPLYTGGDGGRGPARCGIFALPSNTTREQSGATYYGIMEMTGNIWEYCVGVNLNTDAAGTEFFDGSYGDGYLDPTGLWDNPNWPGVAGIIIRGGGFTTTNVAYTRLSARQYITDAGTRGSSDGGRGIR